MRVINLKSRPLLMNLTVGSAIILKAKSLLDVMQLPESMAQLASMFEQPGRFAEVLWELLDCDRSTITFEGFCAALPQAMPQELWQAFTEEVTDFFHEPDQKRLVVACFDSVVQRHRHMIQTQLQAILGEPSGSLPESSDATHDLTHCDNLTIWHTDVSGASGPLPQA